MKRLFCIIFSAVLLAGLVSGCAAKPAAVGEASDDIMTYKRLDPEKTTLRVSRTGNIDIEAFSEEFEKRNPDVQVVCIDITGGTRDVRPMEDWVENEIAPDVMFWASSLVSNDFVKEHFVNLSLNPVVAGYQSEALNSVSIDVNIYCLPCPSEVQCMLYNKTLFEKYAWEVPTSFDGFVALCDRITADTNGEIQPWNPNAKYSNEFITVMEGFLYEELFGGGENRAWYDSVMDGSVTSAEHFRPMFDAVNTLIEHGILREEHFTYSATTRGNEFRSGQIAMINGKAAVYDSDTYEFGLMPFPSTTGELGYVCKAYNAVVGVPDKENSDAVQDAIDRYIAFFSSEEGQRVFIGDTLQISNVKNVDPPESSALSALEDALDEGHQFTMLSFSGENCGISFPLTNDANSMTVGEKTEEECLAAMARDTSAPSEAAESSEPEHVATVLEDFTVLETSFYIADMYRETAGADIGLIANNIAYRGNLMRIFAGELTDADVLVLLPRSFTNDSTLVKATMTGQQLLDALNDPVGPDDETGDCVYAYSGLKCELAPWNPEGERVLSAKLADGAKLEPDALYTVAYWSGTVFDKYVTEVTDTFEGSWVDLMSAKLKTDGEIAPAADGRVTLIWE